MDQVRTVAESDATVLIRGETGTGKEGLARMVHAWSPRLERPFVVVNLGALPDTLIESELFGYEKGAFTGADRRRIGRFEQADGGTLFLDEVGDAPMSVQVRLLRALQEQEIQRVGGTGTVRVDVRIVAATNRPLERMVEEGTFRSDLYYRINIFPVHLPPLRERREDLRPLVRYFLALNAARMHRQPPRVPEVAWRSIEAHDWPGNVRELENYVQRAMILSNGPELVLPEPPGAWAEPGPGPGGGDATAVGRFDDEVTRVLRAALNAAGGRIYGPGGAAALLGLKPTTLQGKLRRYGISGRGRPPEKAGVR
ncbi:MAG: AAA domain-containing protein [Deltaproteobacteria bacterium]|nr:AAA domain-containing protein [Deltaproteobacteria bacterium]